jgi:hypothetical protein
VYDQVQKFGGSISAEHGIGELKVDKLPHYKSPVALEMMRSDQARAGPEEHPEPGAGDPRLGSG